MITIENKKVHDFIAQKDVLVTEGRRLSRELEALEVKIKRLEEKEKRITSQVEVPKDLEKRGEEIVKEIEKLDVELSTILKKINDARLGAIPLEIKDEHFKLMKDREVLERSRDKIALKVQKLKDKVVPVIQREVRPLLGEYDDIETATIKDGKVIINTFNYLEEWKKRYHK